MAMLNDQRVYLVGGLEHGLIFFLGESLFQRGGSTTNQICDGFIIFIMFITLSQESSKWVPNYLVGSR
jgi:hypothetical protein